MIYLSVNNRKFPISIGQFPNHESFVDVPKDFFNAIMSANALVNIHFKYEGDTELFTLQMLKDFLDNLGVETALNMPYVPYSRMDRQENCRLFSLKSFAKFINGMNFKYVEIAEPHSDVTPALFDRVLVKDMTVQITDVLFASGIHNRKNTYIVYPDAGAQKRYMNKTKVTQFITANKHRDFNSGRITHFTLEAPKDMPISFDAIIMDDLSSKGYTFLFAAKALKDLGAEKISLVVTHCENTILEGEIPKSDLIDGVYTTDSIYSGNDPKIHVVHNFFD